VIDSFDFNGGSGTASGFVIKQAVSQGAADALVKQDEHGGHSDSLFGEAVGVVFVYPLQEAVAFHLAKVITELIEGVVLGRKGKGRRQGLPDLDGTLTDYLWAAVEQHFHEANHAGVLDLNAGYFAFAQGERKGESLK
jgi:hypothetical protein